MKQSIRTGLSFGLTSGIITTLGLIVGLYAGTSSRLAVIGGIITIAIADSLSDSLGIHISQESQMGNSYRHIWESTFSTLAAKFFFSGIFIVPVLFLSLSMAVIVSIFAGLVLISLISYFVAKSQGTQPWKVAFEHLAISVLVVIATYVIGQQISGLFG